MKRTARALSVLFVCLSAAAGFSQTRKTLRSDSSDDFLLQKFSEFNVPAAAETAELRLYQVPKDVVALFIRMETAELQERPEVVLDSALRLCALPAVPELQELASNRILQHAANSSVFNSVLRRVKLVAMARNGCTFNLRLALVAAASDGVNMDLDTAAHSSGLLTRWRIAGPFGHYDDVDFERHWPPEIERGLRERYTSEPDPVSVKTEHNAPAAAKANGSNKILPEQFWFRNGMIALPEYFPSSGVFYAESEFDLAAGTNTQIDVLSSGTYEVFIDGKSDLLHDARYAMAPNRDSSSIF